MSTSTLSDAGGELRSARLATFIRERRWAIVVWASTTIWAVVLADIVRDRYADYRYARFDLGNMVQAVWSTAQGRWLENTNAVTGDQVARLASHVDPILVLLAPLWLLWPSPVLLAWVQVVAVAAGAIPVFLLARKHAGSEQIAALLALAYLAYPWIAWAAVDAFHPVALAIPLLLFAVWSLDGDRLVAFTVCAVLTAATGELMGLLIAGLGIWYALARGRSLPGIAIAVWGVAWTMFSVYVIVPFFYGAPSAYYGVFNEVGGSPTGVLKTVFTDPVTILREATGGEDVLYLFLVSAPVAGSFLLAPGLAAVSLPAVAVNLLAVQGGNTDPHEHYISGILPFVFGAVAIGVGRLSPAWRVRAAGIVLAVSLAATATLGPWPRTLLDASGWDPLRFDPARVRVLEHAVAIVPDDAAVSSTNRVGSHLSARRHYYSVPVLGRAEWIVLEADDAWLPQSVGGYHDRPRLQAFLTQVEKSPQWRLVFRKDDVYVFRRAES